MKPVTFFVTTIIAVCLTACEACEPKPPIDEPVTNLGKLIWVQDSFRINDVRTGVAESAAKFPFAIAPSTFTYDEDKMYAVSTYGTCALNSFTGNLIYNKSYNVINHSWGSWINARPLIKDSYVYTVSYDRDLKVFLYCHNKITGDIIFSAHTGGGNLLNHDMFAAPFIIGEKIIITSRWSSFSSSDRNEVRCLNRFTGQLLWKKDLGHTEKVFAYPASDNEGVFVATKNRVTKLNLITGNLLWQKTFINIRILDNPFSLESSAISFFAASENTAGITPLKYITLNSSSGEETSNVFYGNDIDMKRVENGYIYYYNKETHELIRASLSTGIVKWRYKSATNTYLQSFGPGNLVVTNDHVYMLVTNNMTARLLDLVVLQKEDGKEILVTKIKDSEGSAPFQIAIRDHSGKLFY